MKVSSYSHSAGAALLTLMALTSWPKPGRTQEMGAVWGVWGGRVGDIEIRMCAQSDPGRPFNDDFAAIYTTQDYQIELLDRGAGAIWQPRLSPENTVRFTSLADGSLRLERSPADLWSGVTLTPMEVAGDASPCTTQAFNGPRIFLPDPVVASVKLDGVSYEVVSIIDPSGHGGVSTFQLPWTDPGAATINTWLSEILPTTAEEAPYYSCTLDALRFGAGSLWELRRVPDLITDQFVVVKETQDAFCGGAHPSSSTEWTVFDRETGQQIDTSRWIREDAFYDLGPYAGQGPEIGNPEVARGFRELMVEAFAATDPDPSCAGLLDEVEVWAVRPGRNGLILSPFDMEYFGGCGVELKISAQDLAPYLFRQP